MFQQSQSLDSTIDRVMSKITFFTLLYSIHNLTRFRIHCTSQICILYSIKNNRITYL